VAAAACVAGLALCAVYGPRRRVVVEERPEQQQSSKLSMPPIPQATTSRASEMIAFKDSCGGVPEIRIKLL
jgi:hypothetical protein